MREKGREEGRVEGRGEAGRRGKGEGREREGEGCKDGLVLNNSKVNNIELTTPFSSTQHSMTMVYTRCSQIILQKSSTVFLMGPWARMYCCFLSYPWETDQQGGNTDQHY